MTLKGKLGFCFPQKSRVPFGTAAGRNIWISPCTDLLIFKVLTSGEGTEDSQLSAEHSRLHHHRCQLEQQNTANEGDLECVEREYLSFAAMGPVSISGIGVWGCYWNPREEADEK